MDVKFISRRSPVLSLHGCVASSTPLASEVGIRILKAGGNAADAAVAVAAALNVTEPCSTGIGGDCFCLYYDAKKRTIRGLNGRCDSIECIHVKSLFVRLLPFTFDPMGDITNSNINPQFITERHHHYCQKLH